MGQQLLQIITIILEPIFVLDRKFRNNLNKSPGEDIFSECFLKPSWCVSTRRFVFGDTGVEWKGTTNNARNDN